MEIRLKRVPFHIELAKKITDGKIKGAKIMTGYGQPVRILCFDLKGSYPIAVAVLHNNGQESISTFTEKGYFLNLLKGDKDEICLYVPISYYDYSNFEPQKCQSVLVRDLITDMWIARVATGERIAKGFGIISVAGENKFFAECLPICNLTIKLLGTRMSYDELFEKNMVEKRITMDNKVFDFHEIKTFADACEKLGMKEHLLTGSMGGDRETQGQAQALYKLLIIQKAINNGKWRDKDGWSYYPYWVLYSKEEMERMSEKEKQRKGIKQLLSCADANGAESAGVRCAVANRRGANTGTYYGFPLCFNSEEAALYAANQFEDLFFQYYGIKVKD